MTEISRRFSGTISPAQIHEHLAAIAETVGCEDAIQLGSVLAMLAAEILNRSHISVISGDNSVISGDNSLGPDEPLRWQLEILGASVDAEAN